MGFRSCNKLFLANINRTALIFLEDQYEGAYCSKTWDSISDL